MAPWRGTRSIFQRHEIVRSDTCLDHPSSIPSTSAWPRGRVGAGRGVGLSDADGAHSLTQHTHPEAAAPRLPALMQGHASTALSAVSLSRDKMGRSDAREREKLCQAGASWRRPGQGPLGAQQGADNVKEAINIFLGHRPGRAKASQPPCYAWQRSTRRMAGAGRGGSALYSAPLLGSSQLSDPSGFMMG